MKSFTTTTNSVVQWCCAKESHKRSGVHYHMAIKLKKTKRWLSSKKQPGISVQFYSVRSNYYTPWKYATKENAQYEESEGHSDLSDTLGPSTIRAHQGLQKWRKSRHKQQVVQRTTDCKTVHRSNAPEQNERGVKRRERLTFEVSEIIVSKNVKHRTQLLAYANMQKNGWKMVLAELVMKHRTKVVNELIEAAWEMHKAQEKLHQRGKCRID